jgi:hypothetical protein
MAGTAVAVFQDHAEADRAALALKDAGVPYSDISLVRKDAGGARGSHADVDHDDPSESQVSHGFREVAVHDVEEPFPAQREVLARVAVGATIGGPLGAIVVATAAAIPGIAPIIASSPTAWMLTISLAGGVLGGLIGALTAGGIPEEAAEHYHELVLRGAILVTILASGKNQQKIRAILETHGGRDSAYFPRLLDSLQSIESTNARV